MIHLDFSPPQTPFLYRSQVQYGNFFAKRDDIVALTFKPQTLAFRLLSLIAISGELPTAQLSRLANYDYAVKTVNKLKQQGLLYTYQRNGLRVLRLTSRGKLLLLTYDPDRFAASLTGAGDTNHIKTEISRRQRLHRVAETLVTMQNAGIFIHRDEKTDVFAPDWQDAPLSLPAFYHSREIKSLGTDFVKIHNARSVGVLLTDRHIFVVYGLHTATLKWSYSAEMRIKALMKTILCRERLHHRYSPDAVRGLILANDWELAYTILSDHTGKPHFLLDGSYDHFHFLTHDHKGECLLQLLCNETLSQQLFTSCLSAYHARHPGLPIEHDAIDRDGRPVLLGCTCDLPRIHRFDSALRLQNRTGILVCFDFQQEMLSRCCNPHMQYRVLDFRRFERSYFEPP